MRSLPRPCSIQSARPGSSTSIRGARSGSTITSIVAESPSMTPSRRAQAVNRARVALPFSGPGQTSDQGSARAVPSGDPFRKKRTSRTVASPGGATLSSTSPATVCPASGESQRSAASSPPPRGRFGWRPHPPNITSAKSSPASVNTNA
ncbi:MAG: hypothetical protein U0527_11665 [Candidatus Eisenbacteria bacterium]